MENYFLFKVCVFFLILKKTSTIVMHIVVSMKITVIWIFHFIIYNYRMTRFSNDVYIRIYLRFVLTENSPISTAGYTKSSKWNKYLFIVHTHKQLTTKILNRTLPTHTFHISPVHRLFNRVFCFDSLFVFVFVFFIVHLLDVRLYRDWISILMNN